MDDGFRLALMMDGRSRQRFADGCAQASAGYAAAATAACTNVALQMFDFWSTALEGLTDQSQPAPPDSARASTATAPESPTKPSVDAEPAFGLSFADWCPFPWLDQRRMASLAEIDFSTPPILAWMSMANGFPLRGPSTSWPIAQAMIDSGVPRKVAWPTAEAHAAALDAADAASHGLRQILASYQSQGGYAMVTRSLTPSVVATTLTVMMMNASPTAAFLGSAVDLGPWLNLFST
jgi:hypothetical protein